jgi:hypothetical protein
MMKLLVFEYELSLDTRLRACDEHPKKMTVAQAANPRSDVPSEVRLLLRQHSTLEISPLITIITRWLVQLGLVICNKVARWSVVMLV